MMPSRSLEEFNRCWPWLEPSLEFGGFEHNGKIWVTHRRQDVLERIATGKAYFWPAEACAFITEIYDSPSGLRSHHTWVAGGDLEEIKYRTPAIEDWGRACECHRQTGWGRRGWLRAFTGYREIGVRREKSLL